jgi:hypothetical protein
VFERHRNERPASFLPAAYAGKCDNRADIVACAPETRNLARSIELLLLQADRGGHGFA